MKGYKAFNKKLQRFEEILSTIPQTLKFSKFITADIMTDKQKEDNPDYITTGGFVSVQSIEIDKADKWAWWCDLNDEDKQFIQSLPHYDEKVFFEAVGIEKALD